MLRVSVSATTVGNQKRPLLDDFCKVDLLVLDEVGIQRGSSGEKVILNQVIDRRLIDATFAGVLTNLTTRGCWIHWARGLSIASRWTEWMGEFLDGKSYRKT